MSLNHDSCDFVKSLSCRSRGRASAATTRCRRRRPAAGGGLQSCCMDLKTAASNIFGYMKGIETLGNACPRIPYTPEVVPCTIASDYLLVQLQGKQVPSVLGRGEVQKCDTLF